MTVDLQDSGMLAPAYVAGIAQVGDSVAVKAAGGDAQALIPNRSTETPATLPWWVIAFILVLALIFIGGML